MGFKTAAILSLLSILAGHAVAFATLTSDFFLPAVCPQANSHVLLDPDTPILPRPQGSRRLHSTDEVTVHTAEDVEKATAASNRGTGFSLNRPSYQVNYQLQRETQWYQKPGENVDVAAVQPRPFIGSTAMDAMLPAQQIKYGAPYTYTSQQPYRDPSSPYNMLLSYSQVESTGLKETPSAAVTDNTQIWPYGMSYAYPQVGCISLEDTPPAAVTDKVSSWPYDMSYAYPEVGGIGLEDIRPDAVTGMTPRWPNGMLYVYPQVGGSGYVGVKNIMSIL